MRSFLVLFTLLLASAASAERSTRPPRRHTGTTAPRPSLAPPPAPAEEPAAADTPDNDTPADVTDEEKPLPSDDVKPPGDGDDLVPEDADDPFKDLTSDDDSSDVDPKTGKPKPLTKEEALGAAIVSGCCCLVVVGVVALIVWLVARSRKPTQPTGGAVSGAGVQPGSYVGPTPAPPVAPGAVPAPMGQVLSLSVMAVAVPVETRAELETHLLRAGATGPLEGAEARARLVREVANALLAVQPQWKLFGYGEREPAVNNAALEQSYRAAVDDFRLRAQGAPGTPGEGLVVVALVLATRAPLQGVSRLDDATQVRALLEDRARILSSVLLGAEVFWAPELKGAGLSEATVMVRFPEMQRLP